MGRTDTGNSGIGSHSAQAVETRSGDEKVAGVDDIHMDDVSLQERRGVAGAT